MGPLVIQKLQKMKGPHAVFTKEEERQTITGRKTPNVSYYSIKSGSKLKLTYPSIQFLQHLSSNHSLSNCFDISFSSNFDIAPALKVKKEKLLAEDFPSH